MHTSSSNTSSNASRVPISFSEIRDPITQPIEATRRELHEEKALNEKICKPPGESFISRWQTECSSWILWRAVLAEFWATLFFVLIGTGSAVSSGNIEPTLTAARLLLIGLCFGLGIAFLVASVAELSGGHLNPAVTIALFFAGKVSFPRTVLYIIAQLAGGVGAAALVLGLFPNSGNLAANGLYLGISVTRAFFMEFVFSAILIFTIFSRVVDPISRTSKLASFGIGFAVGIANIIVIPFTNCSVNPARSFGPSLIANYWDAHWIFWVAPITGGLLAAIFYECAFLGFEGGLMLFAYSWVIPKSKCPVTPSLEPMLSSPPVVDGSPLPPSLNDMRYHSQKPARVAASSKPNLVQLAVPVRNDEEEPNVAAHV